MKTPKRNDTIARGVHWVFERLVRVWPADSREWAMAMRAELPEMKNSHESLMWLAGGIMSLGHAWWHRILFGRSTQANTPAPVKSAGALPGALLLLAVAACALPAMRQGIMAVAGTWFSTRGDFTTAQLEKMGREAEQKHDSKMLAFVAMRMPVTSETLHWADLAVSLNPELTWVYFEMEGYIPDWQMTQQDFAQRVTRLEEWDPNNATPYLLEGGRAFDQYHDGSHAGVSATSDSLSAAASALAKNPVWSASMDKAFRAARFDDYSKRRFDLNLTVMREHGINHPVDLLYSMSSARIPSVQAIEVYSAVLIHDGELRESSGDLSGAAEDYWRVAHFGQQMQRGGEALRVERWVALDLAEKSFLKLQSVLERSGRSDEARYASYEVENARAGIGEITAENRRMPVEQRAAAWSSLVLHFSAATILLTAFLSCGALLWLALGFRSEHDAHSALRRWLYAVGKYSPALLAFAIVFFFMNYQPYFTALRDASPENAQNLVRMFGALLEVPSFSPIVWYGSMRVYFWSGVSAIDFAALALVVTVALRARIARSTA